MDTIQVARVAFTENDEELASTCVFSSVRHRQCTEIVLVRVNFDEANLREAVKLHGGRWHQDRKLWSLRVGAAYKLGLDNRIVEEGPTP